MRPTIEAFTENPWEGIEMPDGFDPDKNEFLNPPKAEAPKTSKGLVSQLIPREDGVGVKLTFMVNGERKTITEPEKTQDEWIEFWNSPDRRWENKGGHGYLAGMPDYYRHLKFMADEAEKFDNFPDDVKDSLRDLTPTNIYRGLTRGKYMVTSTRIEFGNMDGPEEEDTADILHLYGSPDERAAMATSPDYQAVGLDEIALGPNANMGEENARRGEIFLQALFETKDDAATINMVIKKALGADSVCLWAPGLEEIRENKAFVYRLNLNEDNHFVIGFVTPDKKGYSFPIEYSNPGKRAKFDDLSAVDGDVKKMQGGQS